MTEVKLTKNALRDSEIRLTQLQKYLPTLQLKKAMLQLEVNEAKTQLKALEASVALKKEEVFSFASLLGDCDERGLDRVDVLPFLEIEEITKRAENIAGVEFEAFVSILFKKVEYSPFDHPIWLDSVLEDLKELIEKREQAILVRQKKEALEHELRQVSIRVNLFDKVLIPKSKADIKKIKIFLQDQYLAAVSQAKVAKEKQLKKAAL